VFPLQIRFPDDIRIWTEGVHPIHDSPSVAARATRSADGSSTRRSRSPSPSPSDSHFRLESPEDGLTVDTTSRGRWAPENIVCALCTTRRMRVNPPTCGVDAASATLGSLRRPPLGVTRRGSRPAHASDVSSSQLAPTNAGQRSRATPHKSRGRRSASVMRRKPRPGGRAT
jgi:hypothetical protein